MCAAETPHAQKLVIVRGRLSAYTAAQVDAEMETAGSMLFRQLMFSIGNSSINYKSARLLEMSYVH